MLNQEMNCLNQKSYYSKRIKVSQLIPYYMKKMLCAWACLFTLSSNAQLPSFEWAKLIGGIDGKSLVVDNASNVYTLGMLSASGLHDFDPGPGTFILDGANGTGYILKLTSAGIFVWAKQLPTGSTMETIKVDAAQNVYVIGHYSLTLDFDPGPAVFNLTAAGQNDVFILKLDAAGDFLWAKSLGGTQADVGLGITVGADGSVYTVGYFFGTSDFDPGPGTANMSSGILNDCFLSKLNSNGDYVWALQIPGGFNQGRAITIDGSGNLLISGWFQGTKDFDPSPSTLNLTSAGAADVFIWKLNPAGSLIWAKSIGGIGSDDDHGITTDASDNVYVCGRFTFTPDFDPGPGTFGITSLGGDDIFILKLNSSGDFVWAKRLGGANAEGVRDISVDVNGNVFTTGIFVGTGDFDPGPATFDLTSFVASADIFISKLNTDGDFVWAIKIGSVDIDNGLSLFTDATGNVYATGFFQGTVDFDPGTPVFSYTVSTRSAYILKLGVGSTVPLTLLDFSGNATFNGIALKWQTSSEVNTKSFEIEWGEDGQYFKKIGVQESANNGAIHKYSFLHPVLNNTYNYYRLKMLDNDGRFTYSKVIRINVSQAQAPKTISPNPVINTATLTIQAHKNETIQFFISDANGKLVSAKSFMLVKGRNFLRWDLQTFPAGTYFISSGSDQFYTLKFIKQ